MSDFFINPDITNACTPDSSFYTDPQLFEITREKIFASSWQFAGDTSSLKEAGDLLPFTLLEHFLDEPLLFSRDDTGKLHVLSNVCTHRGNILADKPCKQTHLRCRYHGRIFNLDGSIRYMPEFKEVKNFPSPTDDLTRLSAYHWGPLSFVSLRNQHDPNDFFGDMVKRMQWLPLDQLVYRPGLSRDYTVQAHWALYCENYLEGFHIPFVHAGLNSVVDYGEYSTELFFPYSSLQLAVAKREQDCFALPPSSPDYGKNIAAYYFWVFPNMMFNFYPWGLSLNIVSPLGIHKTRVSFLSYVWDESKMHQGAGANLDQVEMEDEEIVELVQKGIRSRFYKHGRYSATKEQGLHHFHRILSHFIN